jgi:hypothetical protein
MTTWCPLRHPASSRVPTAPRAHNSLFPVDQKSNNPTLMAYVACESRPRRPTSRAAIEKPQIQARAHGQRPPTEALKTARGERRSSYNGAGASRAIETASTPVSTHTRTLADVCSLRAAWNLARARRELPR